MTGTNDKLRGLLLAVLMVTSVFAGTIAFAGTAAAANADSLAVTNNAADETTTLNAQLTGEGESAQQFTIDFSGSNNFDNGFASDIQSGDISLDYSGGSNPTVSSASRSNGGATLTFSTSSSFTFTNGETLTITVQNSKYTNPTVGGTYTAELDIGGTSQGTVSYAVAQNDEDLQEGDIDLETAGGDESSRFWQGQELEINDGTIAGQTLELFTVTQTESGTYRTSNFQGQISVDGNGEAVVPTSNREGTYALVDASTDEALVFDDGSVDSRVSQNNAGNARFSVTPQTLDASFDDAESDNSGADSETNNDFMVESNRANYDIYLTSTNLDDDELQAVIGGQGTVTDDGVQLSITSNDATLTANFSGVDVDDYEFTAEVVDTGVTASDTVSVVDPGDTTAEFGQAVYSDNRGDIVEFTINMTNTDTAVVKIGESTGQSNINYGANLTVEDGPNGDADGEVTVLFNTFTPNGANAFTVDDSDDDVTLDAHTGTADTLDAADYDMNVSTGGTETDVAAISLTENSLNGFTLYTAPDVSDVRGAGDAEDIAALKEDGLLTEDSTIAMDDTVVHEISATGLEGAIEAQGGSSVEAKFQNLLDSGDAELTVLQTRDSTEANANRKALEDLNLNVISDAENDTYYVNFPVANDKLNTNTSSDVMDGDTYRVKFQLNPSSGLVDNTTNITTRFTVEDRELSLDTNEELDDGTEIITVDAAANQTVTGDTNIAPGTDVTVRARATGDSPFLLSQTVAVQPDNSFNASFDFTNVSTNQSFTVTASARGVSDEVDALVNQPPTATVDVRNQTSPGDTVVVRSASLSEGGFITIHDNTLSDSAITSVRGTSDYLEPGTSENVTIVLDDEFNASSTIIAMPHQDTNDNEVYDFVTSEGASDGPYTDADGNIVTDSARLTIQKIATVDIQAQTGQGDTVNVARARLPNGGFVTIHDNTVSDDPLGSVRGTSDYLNPGVSTDISISLDNPFNETQAAIAMPHQDSNDNEVYDFVSSEGDEDAPYLNADDQIVIDSATYTVESVATVTMESQSGDGSTVTVAAASLPAGGFVTIHDNTVGNDPVGSVRGTSEYLEPGAHENIEITLDEPFTTSQPAIAMPHRDTDGDQTYDFVSSEGEDDSAYLDRNDNIVTAQGEYTVATPTPTPTEVTPTATATATATATETMPPETTEPPTTTTSGGQPGFTVIVALLAFLAAALIAVRRD